MSPRRSTKCRPRNFAVALTLTLTLCLTLSILNISKAYADAPSPVPVPIPIHFFQDSPLPITEAELMALYHKVPTFKAPYAAGDVYAIGPAAMTILNAGDSIGVVAKYGKGKIAVLGSEDFASPQYLKENPGVKTYVDNVKKWLATGTTSKLVYANPYMTEKEAQNTLNYIKNGGSVLLCYKGWVLHCTPESTVSRIQPTPVNLSQYPVQKLLNTIGIIFTPMTEIDMVSIKSPNFKEFSKINLSTLWDRLCTFYNIDDDPSPPAFAQDPTKNYYSDFDKTKDTLGALHPQSQTWATMQKYMNSTPWLTSTNITLQHFLLRQIAIHKPLSLSPNQAPHPAAAQFPGLVMANPTASPISKVLNVSLAVPSSAHLRTNSEPQNWISTSLFAPAGKNIVVTLPKGVSTLTLQIGAHVDTLDFKGKLERMPVTTGSILLKPGVNTVSSPFGGLIYLIPVKPSESIPASTVKSAAVKIDNAIAAPSFQLGAHTKADWQNMIATSGAPWSELSGKRMILTVPTEYAKKVSDPIRLMETWDQIVLLQEKLAGITPANAPKVPWRFNTDTQLGVGFMYSGYPIMAYSTESADSLLSPDLLTQNEWGAWHELGHNYQMELMTWSEMGEVTNNLFSLYIQEHYKNASYIYTLDQEYGPTPIMRANTYLEKPQDQRDFSALDPFERLVMLNTLKEKYGWDFYTKLHTYYRNLPPAQFPTTDSQKRALFIKACSTIAGEDLTPYFNSWGVRP